MRIGIYAGTFDPVHNGHVAFAKAALKQAGLDKIIFLPEPEPRGKINVTPVERRLAMLRLALKGQPAFAAMLPVQQQCDVAGTVPWLQQMFAGADLALLLGTDVAAGVPKWPGAAVLLKKVDLIIGVRQGADLSAISAPLADATVTFVQTNHAHLAASTIRQTPSARAVPPQVLAYAQRHGLYIV